MFQNKAAVDKHVADILKRIRSENEKNLKGYCIANLYYSIKEYDSARRYLSAFLSVKDRHAGSHKLMGQIFEALNIPEKALQSYKRSLEIDENQKELVLKISSLYCKLPIDVERGRYWADRAELLFPHNDTVFQLRERLIKADGEQNSSELENLIASELVARPKDVTLRIKLLKLFLDTERVDLAYDHATKVEAVQPFPDSFDWYSSLDDVFEAYVDDEHHVLDIEFYMHLLTSCDHLIYLTHKNRSIPETSDALIKFDMYLEKARKNIKDNSDAWNEFYQHMQGQLYLHAATFMLKRAKLDQGKWKESSKMSAALLFTALSFEPNLKRPFPKCETETISNIVAKCRPRGAYRASQSGHILLSMSAASDKNWAQQIKDQCSSIQMKERIFQRITGKTDTSKIASSSFLCSSSTFVDVEYTLLSSNSLSVYDEECCKVDPSNIQLLVWLCLQMQEHNPNEATKSYKLASIAFKDLQTSCSEESLLFGYPETICKLDAKAFILASVDSTNCAKKYRQSVLMMPSEKSMFYPLVILDKICTNEQEQWWTLAHKLFKNNSKSFATDTKSIVTNGLEVIRGVGNHGLSVNLLCTLAKYFIQQSTMCDDDTNQQQRKEYLMRSIHYWQLAIDKLERLSNNLTIRYPKTRMFPSSLPELSSNQVKELLDEGRMCIGTYSLNNQNFEKALKIFQLVNNAEAAFKQAQVYKIFADQETGELLNESSNKTNEHRNALLIRARDCCYLALDRLRDKKSPTLLKELTAEIKDIEARLYNREDIEEDSDGEEVYPLGASIVQQSTPVKQSPRGDFQINKPSPLRLELQMKSLAMTQHDVIKSISDQNKMLVDNFRAIVDTNKVIVETNRAVNEELKINKCIVEQIKDEMAELHKELTDLRLNQATSDSNHKKSRYYENEHIEEFLEENYGSEEIVYHQNQASYSRPAAYPMTLNETMYRHPPDQRLTGPTHPGTFLPSNFAYPSSMLRFPQFTPGGLPVPPPMYNTPHYMPPGSFTPQIPSSFPDQSHGYLTPANTAHSEVVPTPVSDGNTLPNFSTPIREALSKNIASKTTTTQSAAAHSFQIPMPASAVTPTKLPFQLDTPGQKTDKTPEKSPNISANREVDYMPKSPDFKPIIPLPDEVPVVTGEENETVKFSNRAKLYRFNDNQWKERGVGDVRILVNEGVKKARLLMRREQIHKICANHQLLSGMNLAAKSGSNQAWIWSAQDFSEEEVKVEKFCIRFKDADIANEFKFAFDDCVKLYGSNKSAPKPSKVEAKPKTEAGFGNKFAQKAGTWNCESCLINNNADTVVCVACNTKREGADASNEKDKPAFTNETPKKEPSFTEKMKGSDNGSTGFKFTGFSSNSDGNNKTGGFSFAPKDGTTFSFGGAENQATKTPQNASLGGFSFSKPPQVTDVKPAIEPVKEATVKTIATSEDKTDSPFASFTFNTCKPNTESKLTPPAFSGFSFKRDSTLDVKEVPPNVTSPNRSFHDEYEPNIDFKPVVPLPDLIDAKTGEEDENKLFGEKAKLYRFDTDSQQWKEKGVGELKLLKHKVNGKVRVLMRRDQVLKLCSNHYLNSSMALLPMEGSDRAWMWSAADYSEEEVKNEKLAAKFKSPDVACRFKEEFDKCLSEAKSTPAKSAAEPAKNNVGSLAGMFKPKTGSWECDSCLLSNDSDKTICPACGTKKAGSADEPAATQPSQPSSGSFVFKTGGATFGGDNTQSTGFTFGSKPFSFGATAQSTTPSSFNFSTGDTSVKTGAFDLGKTIENALNKPVEDKTDGFKPGNSSDFSFSLNKQPSPSLPSRTSKTSESNDEVEPSNADDITFEPVVPLPPQVDVKTGEEDDELLYTHRAKLFRMVDKEWKERGIGDMKILHNKTSNKIRLVMRREQILKLCCNHFILPDTKFLEMNDRSYIWSAKDFSEDQGVDEKFAIRFKTSEIAKSFFDAVTDAQKRVSSSASEKPSPPDSKESKDGNSKNSFIAQPKLGNNFSSANSKTTDTKNALNSFSFKIEEKNSDAKQFVFGSNANSSFNANPSNQTNFGTSGFVFGQNQSIFGNLAPTSTTCNGVFGSFKDPEIEVVYEKKSPAEDVRRAKQFQLPDNFFSYQDCEPCKGCRGCDKSPTPEPIKQASFIPASVVAEPTSTFGSNFGSSFRADDTLSLEFLSKHGQAFAKNDNQNFKFEGAGSKLVVPKEGDDDNDQEEDADPDPQFKPIVPLPDKVEVKCEEDEDILFSHRAKLYRYDSDTKQWKERGIGEMKILKHRIKKNTFRILMRREQVHKVACNHAISTTLEINPLSTSLTSWCWSALDYSESEAKVQKLAVKFKTEDLARQFKTVVDQCIEELMNDDDEEDDEELMFCKTVSLGVLKDTTSKYEIVGKGQLKMSYNDESNGGRIQLYNSSDDKLVCDHMVSMRMDVSFEANKAYWSALDSSNQDCPILKKFEVSFSSTKDVELFSDAFNKAKEYAQNSNIEYEDQFYNPDESDEEYQGDGYEDVSDDEESIMFYDSVTFAVQLPSDSDYQVVGNGNLIIFYDDNQYGMRVKMELDNKKLVCDHMIALQTSIRIQKNQAFWSAIDSSDPYNATKKMFRATFSTESIATKFENCFAEGKEIALSNGIVEHDNPK